MTRTLLITVVALGLGLIAARADAATPTRVCLDAAQARAAVLDNKLANPVVAQRSAEKHVAGAELLRSRLCRWNEDYFYEISLLPRDGKVTQVYVRAIDGQIAAKPDE